MPIAPLLALSLCAAPAAFQPASPDQIPNYFNRPVTEIDLRGKGLRELAILRNTIYSRYGWDGYRKQWLHDYFHAQPWFKPNPDFKYTLLSKLDHDNAHAIAKHEAGLSRGELEKMELDLFKKYRVTFNDMPTWKLNDGKVVTTCEPGERGGLLEQISGPQQSRDCLYANEYKRDPKSTLATIPSEARTELGLIQRAMGFFALDGDDHLADPNALDKLLKLGDLRQLSGRDLRILRNTIYARRGRPFKSPVLKDYFHDKDWYHEDAKYTDARLTDIDKRNVALIKSVEEELGGPVTDDEQQKSLQDPNFDGA
ncbi:MAG: YARHG domain-containing protein [Deltaproteobacteria bacterium]|nr:YARHG domain-containing protein [Deltaproteobacteria bacterium]